MPMYPDPILKICAGRKWGRYRQLPPGRLGMLLKQPPTPPASFGEGRRIAETAAILIDPAPPCVCVAVVVDTYFDIPP